jgi:hypothetical protein
MSEFVNSDAKLLCTGCPGAPGQLDTKTARTVKLQNGTIGVESDKSLVSPGFGTCVIIPTRPQPCQAKLGSWMKVKSDVKVNGESLVLFPNTIPCSAGPGLISVAYPGQLTAKERANPAQGGTKPCKWTKCDSKHEFDITYPGNGVVERKDLKSWAHPSTQIIALGITTMFQAKPKTTEEITEASNYPYQKHHVIPAAVIEKRVPKIKHNLELLGFDINNEGLNGISLPEKEEHIKWHGLQAHRGCHPSYNNEVFSYLSELEGTVHLFCREDKQGELWEEIADAVQYFRKEIVENRVTLRSGSEEYRELTGSTKTAKEMAAAAVEAAKSHI